MKFRALYFLYSFFILVPTMSSSEIVCSSNNASNLMDKYQLHKHMKSFKNRIFLYGSLVSGKCPKAYRSEVLEKAVDDLLFYGNGILFCGAIWQLKRLISEHELHKNT